jgi:hypothetical protein
LKIVEPVAVDAGDVANAYLVVEGTGTGIEILAIAFVVRGGALRRNAAGSAFARIGPSGAATRPGTARPRAARSRKVFVVPTD